MRLTAPWISGRGGRSPARLTALACLLGLVVLAGRPAAAGGQDDGEDETTPTGVYSVTIGRNDLPQGLAGGPALIGQWTLTLKEDGTYEVARQDVGVVAAGAYEVSGATLTFADWTGIVCGGGDDADDESAEVSYAWESSGDDLTLTPVQDTCRERQILFTTRAFGSFAACTTQPLTLEGIGPGAPPPAGTPVSDVPFDPNNPVGPPAAASPAATEEGEPAGEEVAAALDALLKEATGCWGTGDPARFLPLHSQEVVVGLLAPLPGAPPDAFLEQLRSLMAAPVSFELIGGVTQTDPTSASAYVEITFDGAPIPQRLDFVQENGAWLFAFPFFFGPPGEVPTPEP